MRERGDVPPFGTVPRQIGYRVAAIFEIGVYDYDNAFVVMPMEDAQTLLLTGDAIGIARCTSNPWGKVSMVPREGIAETGSNCVDRVNCICRPVAGKQENFPSHREECPPACARSARQFIRGRVMR